MKTAPLVVLSFSVALTVQGGDALELKSPDGTIRLEIPPGAFDRASNAPSFRVRYREREVVGGSLGLELGDKPILETARLKAARTTSTDTTYTVPFGKNNPVRDHYNELSLELESGTGPGRPVRVDFRAYDDGVGFRFVLAPTGGDESVEVTGEPTAFRLPGDPRVWPLFLENYRTPHEAVYTSTNLANLATNRLIGLPFVAAYDDGLCLAFTEANLRNYAGLYLRAEAEGGHRLLRCDLAPLPGQTGVKVRGRPPVTSPWRVILIGAQPGRLIESNLILNLNDPPVIGDLSWLKAGKTTWYWWNGPYQEPVGFTVGLNWETMKHYIDFCARNGLAFHAIVSTPDEFPWYYQTQKGFGPGPDTDVTRPRDGFPMERVADYARSRGVGLRLWVHWKPLSDQLEQAFTQYERWGISGLMVDFLDRDDQEMVLFAERVLQSAARHHLHIQFHGVWEPTGVQRTYPNLLNHEGVLNLEYLKWSDLCDPKHDLIVPFTRLVAGPMDYHLGGFRAAARETFKPRMFQPSVFGTRCHQLAMYVVYENPMPMVCDAPTAYEGQPGFDFIRQVPTTWNETRVPAGKIGEFIVVARRNESDWYLGAMTDWTARNLDVPIEFLPRGSYRLEVWADDPNSADPNALTLEQRTFAAPGPLAIHLNSGGGQVMRLRPAQP